MAQINGKPTNGKGKPGKAAQGTTYKEDAGCEEDTTEWLPSDTLPEGTLTANVNVSYGARIGLPDYSDARCGASLTLPVAATEEEIESGFEYAAKWCENKVQAMIDQIQEDN